MQVDESRRDDQSARVDRSLRQSRRNRAALDAHDAIADDRDVAAISRRARAIDDRAVRDDDVVRALCRDARLLRGQRVSAEACEENRFEDHRPLPSRVASVSVDWPRNDRPNRSDTRRASN